GSDYSGSLLNGQNNNFVTDDSLIITPSFDALKATISTENRTLSLDGINDRVSIPNSTSINFGTNDNFTVETLVKVDPNQLDLGNGDNDIIEKWSGSGGYPFVIRYLRDSGKIVAARYDGSTSASVYSTVSLNDGQFHHIAFVKNGDTLQLYIDGQLDGSAADTTSNSTQNDSALFVGNRNDKNHFRGELDELRIWNTARSKEDINAFRDSKLTGAESGLVGYWNFDEDSSGSTVIQDIKGNLNGTLISGQSNHITAYADQDIDNDGDLDRIIHNGDGSVQLSRNNGSSLIEQFGIDNPFEGITLKAGSSIAFGDVDDDGDTDAFAVNADGTVSYYQTQDGLMSRVTGSDSPVDELTGYSDIMFIDLDGDGDLDLVLKDDLGLTNYLENL
ncbi:MAG: LamG domain-containing protein, partial [Cyanobacteria bacterium J06649_12]